MDELVESNRRLVQANQRLEARVAELERRLKRSSRNSSLPLAGSALGPAAAEEAGERA